MIIQLRLRSEFSFKKAFGPILRVAQAAKDIGATHAALVDEGTWGHVRWAKACAKVGITPLFGCEIPVPDPETGHKPAAWVLAADTRALYRLSTAARVEGADVHKLFREAKKGVIRFAGAALTDPREFDYIDINPASPVAQRRALALHEKTGKPLVITSDNAYPKETDKGAFLAMGGRERNTPQHILARSELFDALATVLTNKQFGDALMNGIKIAKRCATSLPTAPLLKVEGDLRKVVEKGRKRRLQLGHLQSWPKEYKLRLDREVKAIEEKEFESYFLVVADLVNWAKQRMLVGPGRGSSAGSLLCYLTAITEVDPIPHGLLFERFIDFTRKDLPDIDIDFNDNKRELVFTYLAEKYGRANVARIGNINTFKAKSVLSEVCKRFLIPDFEKFNIYNVLIEYSSGDERYGKGIEDTFLKTDAGQSFARRFPNAMVMTELENHASHTGVHAAGVIVSMEPVSDYCTVGPDGVAQIDKPDGEALNLLKIDALGLSTLGIIEDAGVVTAEELYALKLDDPKVLEIFNSHKFSSVFQFEGPAQRQVSEQIQINDFRTIDHITALARPGPLGGGAASKYVNRKAGREEITTTHPRMSEILSETFGVVLYQEQVMRIVRQLGQFSWEDTTTIRKAMSGRKGEEYFNQKGAQFIEGAATIGIDGPAARAIWSEICTFGAWGMNQSHTTSYAVISYWCAWMKAYHPLEYAAACLRGAKDDASAMAVLREMTNEGVQYVPFDIDNSLENWTVIDGKLIGGFTNLVGIGPAKAKAAIETRAKGALVREKYEKLPVKFADLYPLHTKYADLYSNPEANGCAPGSVICTSESLPPRGNCLYLGTLKSKRPGDQNEAVRIAKRGGKRIEGNSLFVDFMVTDDLGTQIICRARHQDYLDFGRRANEELQEGDDLLVRGRRLEGFSMLIIDKIKCLTRDGAVYG